MIGLYLWFVLVSLLLFIAVLSCQTFRYWRERPEPTKETDPFDLTLLSKEDYDFLVANGLEPTPEAQRHFYPPAIYHRTGGIWTNRFVDEQRRGIEQQKQLLLQSKLQSKIIAGDKDGAHVELSSNGFQSWIETEKVRG